LYPYLWHGFAVKIVAGLGFIQVIHGAGEPISLMVLLLISILLTVFFSLEIFSLTTNQWLFQPFERLLIRSKVPQIVAAVKSREKS